MYKKISREQLLKMLDRDYCLVSLDNAQKFIWTCSTPSRSKRCVDAIIDPCDDYMDTIKIADITHVVRIVRGVGDILEVM